MLQGVLRPLTSLTVRLDAHVLTLPVCLPERLLRQLAIGDVAGNLGDLLDVSRIARGRIDLKDETFEIAEAVAKAIEMSSPLLEQRRHSLAVEVPRQGLTVRGDSARVSQVIANLLTNAAKYTSPGGSITLLANEQLGQVVLSVRDTGVGIAPDILPQVFELFVQGRQAADRAKGGLGLGLSIGRSLVERHGGSVEAHSDGPERGSTFTIRLPKAAHEQDVQRSNQLYGLNDAMSALAVRAF